MLQYYNSENKHNSCINCFWLSQCKSCELDQPCNFFEPIDSEDSEIITSENEYFDYYKAWTNYISNYDLFNK